MRAAESRLASWPARSRQIGLPASIHWLQVGCFLAQMPVRFAKRLPRYPTVPVARLGRLAVALAYHGRKLGGALLWDAMDRASRSEVAVYALVVDAKDEQAESFYLHHGFVAFGDTSRALILPLPKRT